MARSNYRTTSIAEIAAEAGITEPAVYRYFPTKKALFIAIIEDVGKRVNLIWKHIIEEETDPIIAMRQIAFDYYERAMTRRGDLKVLFQALAEVDDDDIRKALRDQFASYVHLLRQLIDRSIEAKEIRPCIDAEAASWSWMSVGFTLNLVSLLGFDKELDKDKLMTIQNLFLASLAADPCDEQGLGNGWRQ